MKKFIASLLILSFLPLQSLAALTATDRAEFTGRNLLADKNPGAENGKAGWTVSSGSFSASTSSPLEGNASFVWDATAASQTFTSAAVTIPEGWKGQPGVVSCRFQCASGICQHTLTAYDGTSNLVNPVQITSATTGAPRTSVNFVFPTSGTVAARTTSSQDEPSLKQDSCIIGLASDINLSQINQATKVGSLQWSATANCQWFATSGSYANFANDTDCDDNARTALGIVSDGSAGLRPALTLTSAPAGDYMVVIDGSIGQAASGATTSVGDTWRLFDGSTQYGIDIAHTITAASASLNTQVPNLVFNFNLSATFTGTLDLQCKASGTNGRCTIDGISAPLKFTVYRFPASSDTIYAAANGGLSAGDMLATASTACPQGTIAADGSSVLRTDYAALFTAVGTTYGSADGTHFTLPDARGVFWRGAGTQTISAINYTGTQGTTQGDQLQGHFHTGGGSGSNEFIYNRGSSGVYAALGAGTAFDRTTIPGGAASTDGANGTPRTGSETRPANISLKMCIRTVAATPAPVILPTSAQDNGSEGAGTTTLTAGGNPVQLTTLTAARTYVLPTANVQDGQPITIVNQGDFALTVQASGGATVATLNVGTIKVIANKATPTVKADWIVDRIRSRTTVASTWTFNGSGGTTGSVNMVFEREGNFIRADLVGPIGTSGTSSTFLLSNTAIPAAFRSASTLSAPAFIRNNGSGTTDFGVVQIISDGTFKLFRNESATAFTNASSCGFQEDPSFIYYSAL